MKKTIISILILLVIGGIAYFAIKNNKIDDTYNDSTILEETVGSNSVEEGTNTDQTTIINNDNNKKIMNAILKTNMGEITIEFSETTPKTVENFTKLAKEGFYNGTKFHRVIKGFMNQGGDPLSKDDSQKQFWGTGGPGYKFNDEISASNKNDVGTISMANSGPNTNGSQFFINVAPNNFLDTKHTVFGKVVSGMDVVTAINNTPTDGSDKPLKPVILESITLK